MQKIAIHSVPRSGSTWLGEILNSSPVVKYCFQPLFSYQFKDFLDENSSKKKIDNFFSLLNDTDDEFINQKSQRKLGILPIFKKSSVKTHIVYKEVRYHHVIENLIKKDNNVKSIFLVRNPVEVMNSWINAPKEFNTSWDIEEQLISGSLKNLERKENFYGLEAWVKSTNHFEYLSKNFEERVLLINYSTLKYDLNSTVKQIYNFCNLEFTNSTTNFLKECIKKNVNDTYSVYRGRKKLKITLSKSTIEKITQYVKDANLCHYINN